ncbi:hypothetical protein F4703DRAFT_1936938 [Phycomyces blakesleeanus]
MVAPADFESVVTMVLRCGVGVGAGFSPGQKIIDNYGFSRRFRNRCDNGVGPGKKENDAVVAPVDFESVVTMVLAQVKKENDAVVAPVDFESVVTMVFGSG